MVKRKIKRGAKFVLQVRCKNKDIAQEALKQFSNFIEEKDGIKGEVILFFNAND